jgi:nitrous oxidase accessory protein
VSITLAFALLATTQLVVGDGGTHKGIGEAVRAAPPGGTIRVRAGTYREPTIRLDRPVALVGEAGAVIDGEGARELLVVASPGVTVQGLTLRNTGWSDREDRAALRVLEVDGCLVERNRVEGAYFGIYVQGARGCVVRGNVVTGTIGTEGRTGNGIHAWGADRLVLDGNTVQGHRDGIYLEFSRHATVEHNVSAANRRYGLHFMYSDSSTYRRNTFRDNGTGVAVMYSRQVAMLGNRFEGHRGPAAYGLLLKEIADSRLERNVFAGNSTALVADGADRLAARDNAFRANGRAIRLLASSTGTRFTGNRFDGNTLDVTANSRRTEAEFHGNWWDAYRGWDLDRDGTGDVPHRPVRLLSVLQERSEPTLLLQRSLLVRLLDAAERAVPALTPVRVSDPAPAMQPPRGQP